MTQADVQTMTMKPSNVRIGACRIDSHITSGVVDAKDNVRKDGSVSGSTGSYQVPYRVMLPQESDVTNLPVAGATSASHVAFASTEGTAVPAARADRRGSRRGLPLPT